jgi:hypothetical protein
MRRAALCIVPTGCALLLGACTANTRLYEGYDTGVVWRALVTVAQQPQYKDWIVAANDVWVDEAERRIEVHRHVRRVYHQPMAPPHREQRTWRFEIRMVCEQPPEAEFLSRGFGLPAEALAESQRYFTGVEGLLLSPAGEAAQPEGDRELMDSMGLDEQAPEPTAPPPQPDFRGPP